MSLKPFKFPCDFDDVALLKDAEDIESVFGKSSGRIGLSVDELMEFGDKQRGETRDGLNCKVSREP